MSASVRSSSNTGWVTASTVTVTKPSGLLEGDLMIFFLVGGAFGGTPSGWTAFPGFLATVGTSPGGWMYYKYASSGDAAASTIDFSLDSSATHNGTIVAIKDMTNLGSLITQSYSSTTNTATPSLTGLTPNSRGNNLLLQFWAGANAVSSISTYAIATSNPTWTELHDSATAGKGMGCAWAVRPEITATGNFSCAGGDGTTDWNGVLVSVTQSLSISVAESITLSELNSNDIGLVVSESVLLTEGVDTDKSVVWNNQNKNTSNWVNQDKS